MSPQSSRCYHHSHLGICLGFQLTNNELPEALSRALVHAYSYTGICSRLYITHTASPRAVDDIIIQSPGMFPRLHNTYSHLESHQVSRLHIQSHLRIYSRFQITNRVTKGCVQCSRPHIQNPEGSVRGSRSQIQSHLGICTGLQISLAGSTGICSRLQTKHTVLQGYSKGSRVNQGTLQVFREQRTVKGYRVHMQSPEKLFRPLYHTESQKRVYRFPDYTESPRDLFRLSITNQGHPDLFRDRDHTFSYLKSVQGSRSHSHPRTFSRL